MMLKKETFEIFGYYPKDLTHGSGKLIISICSFCGEFKTPRYVDYKIFCNKCYREFYPPNLGRPMKDAQKKKISDSREGRKFPQSGRDVKGDKNPMFGKHQSEEAKRKISKANKKEKIRCVCLTCKNSFEVLPSNFKRGQGKYCCVACKAKSQFHGRINCTCQTCGKGFEVAPKDARRGGGKYCSLECARKGNFGSNNSRWKGGKIPKARRAKAKRRKLRYIILLPLREGEVGHHVTDKYVIGIPERVHQMLSGKREKHRALVLQWLKTHDVFKYEVALNVL